MSENITIPKIINTPAFNSNLAIYKNLGIKMKADKAKVYYKHLSLK